MYLRNFRKHHIFSRGFVGVLSLLLFSFLTLPSLLTESLNPGGGFLSLQYSWCLCLSSLVGLFAFSYIKQGTKFCRIHLKWISLKRQLFFHCMLLHMQVLLGWWWDLTVVPLEEFFSLGLKAKGLTTLYKCACFFSSQIFARCFSSDVHLTSHF